MLEAIGNAAEKGAATIGKNNIQLLTEKYPILKWIAGGLVGAGKSVSQRSRATRGFCL